MQKRCVAAVAVAALAFVPASAGAKTMLNVVPHGQTEPGVPWLSTPGLLPADTQARMYDRLTPLYRGVTDAQLAPSADGTGYFKSATLKSIDDPSYISSEIIAGQASGVGPVTATLKRDAYGVPYIFSDSDAGATFASGWVAASDRGLLIAQARTAGVAALTDMPGASAIELILGLYDYKPTQSVMDRAEKAQTKAIEAQGARGKQLLTDIDVYVAGANAFYAANSPSTKPLGRIDIYAANAVKAQFLGSGGGAEVGNAELLATLEGKLGRKRGDAAWNDLRAADDPETTTTTSKRATYQKLVKPAKARGLVRLRKGSFSSSVPSLPGSQANAAAAKSTATGTQHLASNILIASGKRSGTGAPLFAGGPQIGYNYPGLTMEEQIVSPGKRVRGVTSPPFPGYMLIGSGDDFAWTLTSAGTDIIDTYAETLCKGSKTRYVYKGKCRKMRTVKAGTVSKGGQTRTFTFPETVHGSVIGYARNAKGKRIAISQKRSTRDRETVDQLFNQDLTYGRVKDAKSFIRAAGRSPQTFNSFFANATESAFFTSGRMPLRPKGVSPDLPVDGRGKYEWKGVLANSRHPQVTNPSSGYIVNWNNKPAKGWPASDERFGAEGGPQRADLLQDELDRRGTQSLASVLDAENAGATEDVRGGPFFPTLAAMLGRTKAPTAGARQAFDVLQAWHAKGASRVDADNDGKVDDPGVAVMDTAWNALSTTAMCARLTLSGCNALEGRIARYDTPPGGQYRGWHQYMDKDLRTILGRRVKGKYALRYCGKGDVNACSTQLWKGLDAAARTLTAKYGADPAGWLQPAATIRFTPIGLTTMQYTNRPSGIHQVMTFKP